VRETIDWQAHARAVVDDANAVLGPAIGVRLEIAGASAWDWPTNDLEPTLAALHARDEGEGVEWVIGLAGGLPFATPNFHLQGYADIVGKHLVVRSVAVLDELRSIDANYDRLSDDEKSRLRTAVQRRREVATLLHELGHTLGAVHQTSSSSFMYPQDANASRVFDPQVQRVMRAALAHRPSVLAPRSDPALARDLVAAYDPRESSAWASPDREVLVHELAVFAEHADAATKAASAPAATSAPAGKRLGAESLDDVVARLAEADRPRLRTAYDQLAGHDGAAADKTGAPLWTRYPDDVGVQELRCQIAMSIGGTTASVLAACERLQALSLPPRK
jgi:hypothetical protein